MHGDKVCPRVVLVDHDVREPLDDRSAVIAVVDLAAQRDSTDRRHTLTYPRQESRAPAGLVVLVPVVGLGDILTRLPGDGDPSGHCGSERTPRPAPRSGGNPGSPGGTPPGA